MADLWIQANQWNSQPMVNNATQDSQTSTQWNATQDPQTSTQWSTPSLVEPVDFYLGFDTFEEPSIKPSPLTGAEENQPSYNEGNTILWWEPMDNENFTTSSEIDNNTITYNDSFDNIDIDDEPTPHDYPETTFSISDSEGQGIPSSTLSESSVNTTIEPSIEKNSSMESQPYWTSIPQETTPEIMTTSSVIPETNNIENTSQNISFPTDNNIESNNANIEIPVNLDVSPNTTFEPIAQEIVQNNWTLPSETPSYQPTPEAFNQTIQNLEIQKGLQPWFIDPNLQSTTPSTPEISPSNNWEISQTTWTMDLSQMVNNMSNMDLQNQQIPEDSDPFSQMKQAIYEENSEQYPSNIETSTTNGNQNFGGQISLDQLWNIDFGAVTSTPTTPITNTQQKSSKIWLLLAVPCLALVGFVVYKMMPDLFSFINIPTPIETVDTGANISWELGENTDNIISQETGEHGVSNEQDKQERIDDITWNTSQQEIKNVEDDFFSEFEDINSNEESQEDIIPFVNEEENIVDSKERKQIKASYQKELNEYLETAANIEERNEEIDNYVKKHLAYINKKANWLLAELENDDEEFDVDRYNSTTKIIQEYLVAIQDHLNNE